MENTFWTVKDSDGIIRPTAIITRAGIDQLTRKDYGKIEVMDWAIKRGNDCSVIKVKVEEITNQ